MRRNCPLRGDTWMSLDWRLPELKTACIQAASLAATTALEASCARDVFARMFTPPRFSSPARSRAALFRFNRTRLRRVSARAERTSLPYGPPHSVRKGQAPARGLHRPAISHTNRRRPRRSIGPRRCAPRLLRRRWPTPAIPLDGEARRRRSVCRPVAPPEHSTEE